MMYFRRMKHNIINKFQIVVWVDPLDGTKEFTEGKVVLF